MPDSILKSIVPERFKSFYQNYKIKKSRAFVESLPPVDEIYFERILRENLGIREKDNLFVHSSIDKLNLSFPFFKALSIIRKIIGENATMCFPTYPKVNSYSFLKSGEIFDIKKSPSYTGILSEFARRQKAGIRSLHPTKSVIAIGPEAEFLTSKHHESPYPYDNCSPYYLIKEISAKVIGIGVKTTYLSSVHAIDDTNKELFPSKRYHKELFKAKSLDYNNQMQIVETYAHDMKYMKFDLPSFFRKNINQNICNDIEIDGMNFFVADFPKLYSKLQKLAEEGITIYK